MGNETVYTAMAGGNRAPYLDRLYSRIGKRLKLAKAKPADIARVAELFNITEAKSLALLQELGAKPGALRSVSKVLKLATRIAGGPPEVSHIQAAWRDLGV